MTGCTATLRTATVTFCGPEPCLEVKTCIPYEGGWSHVTVTTLTCQNPIGHFEDHGWHEDDVAFVYVDWTDSTPGATPHAPPLRFGDRIVLDDGAHAVYCGRSVREGIHEVVVRGQDGEWSTRRLSIGVDTLMRAARRSDAELDAARALGAAAEARGR